MLVNFCCFAADLAVDVCGWLARGFAALRCLGDCAHLVWIAPNVSCAYFGWLDHRKRLVHILGWIAPNVARVAFFLFVFFLVAVFVSLLSRCCSFLVDVLSRKCSASVDVVFSLVLLVFPLIVFSRVGVLLLLQSTV
jgi:hypothetical protein